MHLSFKRAQNLLLFALVSAEFGVVILQLFFFQESSMPTIDSTGNSHMLILQTPSPVKPLNVPYPNLFHQTKVASFRLLKPRLKLMMKTLRS